MNPKIIIRNETQDDVSAISQVTFAAFKTLEISNHTEQCIIEALRTAKGLAVSLVAEMDGRVIGHIAFSPVTISDGAPDWYGFGPVSVGILRRALSFSTRFKADGRQGGADDAFQRA
jgi:putative acetyltransferase